MKKIIISMLVLAAMTPAFAAKKKNKKTTRGPASYGEVHVASAQYALDLFRKIGADGGNVFFSPHSVQTALAMTALGAKGDTLSGMMKALQLKAGAHEEFGALQSKMVTSQNTVEIANKIWPITGAKLVDKFLKDVETHYASNMQSLDYAKNAEKSRVTINEWVESATNDKIQDLLPAGSVDSSTRMVLTNAVYFKGSWASKFDEDDTSEGKFTIADDNKTDAMMMYQKAEFPYVVDGTFTALAMPYVGDELFMLAVLPREGMRLKDLESSLSGKRLAGILESMHSQTVRVRFPKFKQTYGSKSFKSALMDMGMAKAFSNSADFSGMMTGMNISISDVFHKAFVDVNEEGTEAAAATGVVMMERSMPREPMFNADRPFLYFIVHKGTGRILFMGRMMNPNG